MKITQDTWLSLHDQGAGRKGGGRFVEKQMRKGKEAFVIGSYRYLNGQS